MITKLKNILHIGLIQEYLTPHKAKIAFLYIITILNNVSDLIPIYFMGKIINYVTTGNFNKIINIIIVLFILFICNSILSILETYISNWLNNEISTSLKNNVFNKAITISVNNFYKNGSGHILSLIEGDVPKVVDFFINQLIDLFVSLVTLLISLVFLFTLSPSLSCISIFSFPLGFLAYFICSKKIKKKSIILRQISDKNYSFLNQSLNGIKEIKAFVLEEKINNSFKNLTSKLMSTNLKITILEIISGIYNMFISSLAEWIIIGYGTWQIIHTTLSIGSYVSFNGFLGTLFSSAKKLLNSNMIFQAISISLSRIDDFLSLDNENFDRLNNTEHFKGDITFSNVTFSYPNQTTVILSNFNATFKENTISVLVGPNGIGKSTIMALLEQFYSPDKGDIYIGQSNIKNIALKKLRRHIGFVQQYPLIFNDSLRENLSSGQEYVTNEELDSACRKVGLSEYIDNLEKGYDTILNELSGGQQQKIAIARALIKNPPVLLLDEVTSDLDGRTERDLINLLIELSHEKTIILISHRIAAIVNIPNIYVMDQGKIINKGTHAELIKKCPLYTMLVQTQNNQKET